MVSGDHSELGPLVSSCCELINVKLYVADEEEGEDVIDSIEAVTLGPEGIYPSLIGMFVIIIHPHSAQLMTMTQAHVVFQSFANLPIMICRCLYQEQGASALPVVVCAPAIGENMSHNQSWSPWPKNQKLKLREIEMTFVHFPAFEGVPHEAKQGFNCDLSRISEPQNLSSAKRFVFEPQCFCLSSVPL